MTPDGYVNRILLVDDNPGDVRLAMEALRESNIPAHLDVAVDGADALSFLRREGKYAGAQRPDLMLLDLKLPKKSGLEVLQAMRQQAGLDRIPVVVLTSSEAEQDIVRTYDLQANCYVSKPGDLDQYLRLIRLLLEFWLGAVERPSDPAA